MTRWNTVGAILLYSFPLLPNLAAQKFRANYDEKAVPEITLPDPLKLLDGTEVRDAETWRAKRRPQILELFASQMFGRSPGRPSRLEFEVGESVVVFEGSAVRKEVAIVCGNGARAITLHLLLYVPTGGPTGEVPKGAGEKPPRRAPVFLGLNFGGNHTLESDERLTLSSSWMRDGKGVEDHRATAGARGTRASRWPVRKILARGYGLATMYYGDVDPDFDDGFRNGVHGIFAEDNADGGARGNDRKPDAWGSIAAWAWGLSRALDYLETDAAVDARRVAVVGHSRLGKTSLWAGASDERFALVVSNDSGCGGAALSRRRFGETVARINSVFPHWFCGNFKRYGEDENDLPFDQHMLLALVAPRPVLVCSAEADRWADPRGEFLSAFHAGPVYRLLGADSIPSKDMPPLDRLVGSRVGYHIRPGKHDMTEADWKVYMDFADRHGLRQTRPGRR